MFRFFRKHRWILIIAMAVTAVTFVTFMGSGPSRNNSASAPGDYGTIYGHKISLKDYLNARNEFYLYYWFHNDEWPANMPQKDLEEQIYLRLLLTQKAESLGIRVSDEAAATGAAAVLHKLDRNGQRMTFDIFNTQVLKPANLTEEDFMQFARHDLVFQQLIQTLGSAGDLIAPQEASEIYAREHHEISAQAVFFSATNFISQVTVTPAAVAQFYTNEMAYYRLPDRVQVNYVEFNFSNYLAGAEQKIGKTNLDLQVTEVFRERGMDAVPGAKTEEEAKAKIREELIRQQAAIQARSEANDFATAVFNQTPVRAENFAAVARQKGLTVKNTRPFASQYGPQEFLASEAFVKAAFALTADEPFAGPVSGSTAYYVLALDKQLAAEIPPLDTIRDRVATDFQTVEAATRARDAGTNFVHNLNVQLAAGKSFAAVCVAAGFHPENLPPFSLNTADLPELANRAGLPQLKQAAFSTMPGHASNFEETDEGGFIVFVQKQLPVDRAAMSMDLPEFTAQLRRARENEMFNEWLQREFGGWIQNQAPKTVRDDLMGAGK